MILMDHPQNLMHMQPLVSAARLDYHYLRERLSRNCRSAKAAHDFLELQPVSDPEQVDFSQRIMREMLRLMQGDAPLSDDPIADIPGFISKALPEDSWLEAENIADIRRLLNMLNRWLKRLQTNGRPFPLLSAIFDRFTVPIDLLAEIDRVLGPDGKVRPHASSEYAKLSVTLNRLQNEVRGKMEQIYRQGAREGWVADTGITLRNERLVLPVLVEHKRQVDGLLHDASATGQTVYIEPAAVVGLNNEIRVTELAIDRAMRKIMKDLTNCVRPYIEWLHDAHSRSVAVDQYRSRAILAMEWPYLCCPEIDREHIDLRDAIHPMWLREPEGAQRAVPLNIQLSRNARMIVLSGPNAGGKSVVLKTLGLFQWMFQVGLPLPAREGSKMRVFQHLLVELGDEQSMDDELSTYSAHLTHMKLFLNEAGDDALVLIDEMGSGTDPHMGGPLAEAVLAELVKRGCWGLITTHYNNLKLLAARTDAMRNAAMGFDVAALRPRYTLETGRPGSSFAFEIASRTGLPRTLVDQARAQMAGRQQDVEALLIQLMAREQELADRERLLSEKDRLLDEVLARWNGQLTELSEKRKKLWEQSRTQARELLMQVRRQAESLLADARKMEGSKETLRQILRQIDGAAAQTNELLKTVQQAEDAPEWVGESAQMVVATEAALKPGDQVTIEPEGFQGVIQSIHDREAVLLVGDGFLRLPLSRLGTIKPLNNPSLSAKTGKKPPGGFALRTPHENAASAAAFRMVEELKTELDIRGMRAEEAVELLDKVLERALVAGHPSIRVIHGRGGGILRRLVREHVRRQSFVSGFQNEAFDRGGDGVTLVFMK